MISSAAAFAWSTTSPAAFVVWVTKSAAAPSRIWGLASEPEGLVAPKGLDVPNPGARCSSIGLLLCVRGDAKRSRISGANSDGAETAQWRTLIASSHSWFCALTPTLKSSAARTSRHRAGMPDPDLVRADQGDDDIAVQPKRAIRLQPHRRMISVPVVGVVDTAVFPIVRVGGLGLIKAAIEGNRT